VLGIDPGRRNTEKEGKMKLFCMVLTMVVAMAFTAEARAGVHEKVRTPIGTFVAEYYFGDYEGYCEGSECGGIRCDSVITPTGGCVNTFV